MKDGSLLPALEELLVEVSFSVACGSVASPEGSSVALSVDLPVLSGISVGFFVRLVAIAAVMITISATTRARKVRTYETTRYVY